MKTFIERQDLMGVLINNELVLQGVVCRGVNGSRDDENREGNRAELVEEVIALIQNDPKEALKHNYLGFKNYASFGDQRCDCEYGMGPKHGSIVFSIGRGSNYNPDNADLYIELLMYFRDFKGVPDKSNNYTRYDDLSTLVHTWIESKNEMDKISGHLSFMPESEEAKV